MLPLIHPLLIWFAALAVIPVILHFLLKGQPKKLLFPALRLIQARRKQNVQRLRLKHVWLMLLRMAVIVLLAIALARPRVPPANFWPTLWEWGLLVLFGLLAAGVWWGLTRNWHRQRLPEHVQQHRRWMLSSGLWAAIAVVALLFVVWPIQRRVVAQIKDPAPLVAQNVPVAAVLLFDTSLSMQYREAGQTRLDQGRDIARQLLQRWPLGSKVAIADTSRSQPLSFLNDTSAAAGRMDQLEPSGMLVPLNDRLRAAMEFQRQDQIRVQQLEGGATAADQRDAFLREVYVFTDLAQASWNKADAARLRAELERFQEFNLYLLDLSIAQPTNLSITEVELPQRPVTQGGDLFLRTTIGSVGTSAATVNVELHLQTDTGRLIKQEQATLTVPPGGAQSAEFQVRGLTGNFRQGELRISNGDPLPFDDVYPFTVEVVPPRDILLVSDTAESARLWQTALAPPEIRKTGRVPYRITVKSAAQVAALELDKFAAVFFLDVVAPPEAAWSRIAEFINNGGGFAAAIGTEVSQVNYNEAGAQQALPAKLLGHIRFTPPEYLDLRTTEHPLLKKFGDWGAVAQLTNSAIRRIWRVEPHAPAQVIVLYSDTRQSPALVERVIGRGRSLLVTTSLSGTDWNDLHLDWPYVAFAHQLVQYLMASQQVPMNYEPGQDALVRLDPAHPLKNYLLRTPNRQQLPGVVPEGKTTLVIRAVDQLGQYRVLAADANSTFERAFSVRPNPLESLLNPLSAAELDELLGKGRYSLGRDFATLEKRGLAGQRLGLEVFPVLAVLLWLVFMAEHYVANRFHERADALVTS